MTNHTHTNHCWSVTPELALLLCGPRPARRFFSFRRTVQNERLERGWFCRPE